MPRLTADERSSRTALDYRLSCAMNGNGIVSLTAHETLEALRRGRPIAPTAAEAGRALWFLAEYRFPVLVGAGKTTSSTKVVFDTSSAEYPFTPPRVQVISSPLPWSPHVHPATGSVCLGEGWTNARGKMSLVALVIHVCRILNCDEPDRGDGYVGWNAPAASYWRRVLVRQPLNPALPYPVVPVEITHGRREPDPEESAFEPLIAEVFSVRAESDLDFSPRQVCA